MTRPAAKPKQHRYEHLRSDEGVAFVLDRKTGREFSVSLRAWPSLAQVRLARGVKLARAA